MSAFHKINFENGVKNMNHEECEVKMVAFEAENNGKPHTDMRKVI
jgi:hypothetical protein